MGHGKWVLIRCLACGMPWAWHLPLGRMSTDPLTDEILDVFAREARVDRSRLLPGARADELGVTSLDLALAMFEIEDRYEVQLPQPQPGMPWPTVGEMVQLVRDGIERRRITQALG